MRWLVRQPGDDPDTSELGRASKKKTTRRSGSRKRVADSVLLDGRGEGGVELPVCREPRRDAIDLLPARGPRLALPYRGRCLSDQVRAEFRAFNPDVVRAVHRPARGGLDGPSRRPLRARRRRLRVHAVGHLPLRRPRRRRGGPDPGDRHRLHRPVPAAVVGGVRVTGALPRRTAAVLPSRPVRARAAQRPHRRQRPSRIKL